METRYYVCGLGYDENDCVTDHEQYFGDFDTYEEAYELFVKLQCRDEASFFTEVPRMYQLLIQLEECEEDEDDTECIDVHNEWWIINPKFKDVKITFTTYVVSEYNNIKLTTDYTTHNSKAEAIAFAKAHNWDGVYNNITGEIVWERKGGI